MRIFLVDIVGSFPLRDSKVPRGATMEQACSIWDLPSPGSPTINICMSGRLVNCQFVRSWSCFGLLPPIRLKSSPIRFRIPLSAIFGSWHSTILANRIITINNDLLWQVRFHKSKDKEKQREMQRAEARHGFSTSHFQVENEKKNECFICMETIVYLDGIIVFDIESK